MKSKSLALANGIVGIIGGIILIFGPLLLLGGAVSDVASNSSSASNTFGVTSFLTIVKIAILVLGIIAIIFYKGTNLVKTAAHILLIIGGAVAIVGGSLYLASLKNFKD